VFLLCLRGHFGEDCRQGSTRSQGSQPSKYQPRQPSQARVYSLTPGNVKAKENTTKVVTGTIPLFSCVACILFDSGATYSFISSTYVKLCNLGTEPLEQNICVTTHVGNAVTCRKCVDNYTIVMEWKTLPVKLTVFSMLGFDVILRVDWLSNYGANIDYCKKEVIF